MHKYEGEGSQGLQVASSLAGNPIHVGKQIFKINLAGSMMVKPCHQAPPRPRTPGRAGLTVPLLLTPRHPLAAGVGPAAGSCFMS